MGTEERKRSQRDLMAREATIGPVQDHGRYRGLGCPKCGAAAAAFAFMWCPGKRDGYEGVCMVFGQHLHGQCRGCSFEWREECLDAEMTRDALAEDASRIVEP
jgi:hypothetical protein